MVSDSKLRPLPSFFPFRSPGFELQRSDRRACFSPHACLRSPESIRLLLPRQSQDSEGQGCPCRLRHHCTAWHALCRLGEATVTPLLPLDKLYN